MMVKSLSFSVLEILPSLLDKSKTQTICKAWKYGKPEDLAKRDGFVSAKEMFKTLDKMYDLSNPKQFYVYRWEWLK